MSSNHWLLTPYDILWRFWENFTLRSLVNICSSKIEICLDNEKGERIDTSYLKKILQKLIGYFDRITKIRSAQDTKPIHNAGLWRSFFFKIYVNVDLCLGSICHIWLFTFIREKQIFEVREKWWIYSGIGRRSAMVVCLEKKHFTKLFL